MEQFEDFEFFNAIATSLEAAKEQLDENSEQFDDFPDQENSSDLFEEDRLDDEEPLTVEEKEDILHGIQRLPPQYLKGMWNVVTGLIHNNDREEEEQSPTLMLRQLNSYIKRKTNVIFQEEQPGQEL